MPPAGPVAVEPIPLVVVIDDVGNNLSDLEPFLALPVTFAVLPGLPYSRQAAEMLHRAGREIIVHMPMEPIGQENPGPGAILVSHSDAEIVRQLQSNLDSVPYAVGINNHMGSRAVADPRVMSAVLGFLGERGLFFLDSRTTAESVVASLAPRYGVPFAERDVFLDNEPAEDRVEERLREGLVIASERSGVVLIGHVQSRATAAVLARRLPALEAAGFRIAPLAELAR